MRKNYIPHGTLVAKKIEKGNIDNVIQELSNRYEFWSEESMRLNSENENT